jgi:hypothetical protein
MDASAHHPSVFELPLVPYLAARLGVSDDEAMSELGECLLQLVRTASGPQQCKTRPE